MKKLVMIAGIFALAACGGGEGEEGAATSDDMAGSEVDATGTGTYTGADAEGVEVSLTLNDDGTYAQNTGPDAATSGTWEDNIRGTCLTAEGGEGEECYYIQANDDGSYNVNSPEGVATVMTLGE